MAEPAPMVNDADVAVLRLDEETPEVARARATVLKIRLAPGQRRLAGDAVETLPRADADPNRTPFAVLRAHEVVGFGILDRLGILPEITDAPQRAVLLRAFYIAPEWQGRGVGRAACAALDPLARAIAPKAVEILLTVNEHNSVALRSYLSGGFERTGRRYLGGDVGPQLVLRRPIA
ncbi:N-acetyltransferase [Nocardiopsis gilva YIM 90087]|uniref:N-acetyltransferase n=1 Tax=Nocardiopsis gilva YIM 90087 TaxID=1235441 RepID=A0A223SA03_9ACTN|nr:GNAT family N-acetyltransferase [Nocardiopsis gilva]ASU84964.1 N-acetyltransferase [Nocardiopsis gilva YIM 90087]